VCVCVRERERERECVCMCVYIHTCKQYSDVCIECIGVCIHTYTPRERKGERKRQGVYVCIHTLDLHIHQYTREIDIQMLGTERDQ